jgi:AAA15 family ATPase/GTPase
MLNSLYIKNFRLFKELTIEKLGRVNLIVGRNNSGKTCLLEALWIYGSNANPAVLEKIIYQRDENSQLIDEHNPLRFIYGKVATIE